MLHSIPSQMRAGPRGGHLDFRAHYSRNRQLNLVINGGLSQPACLELEITHLGSICLGHETPLPWGSTEEKNVGTWTQAHRLVAEAGSGQGVQAPSCHPAPALLPSLVHAPYRAWTHTYYRNHPLRDTAALRAWCKAGLDERYQNVQDCNPSRKPPTLGIVTSTDCPGPG